MAEEIWGLDKKGLTQTATGMREQIEHTPVQQHGLLVYLGLAVVSVSYSTLLAIYLAPRSAIQNEDELSG